MAVINFNFKTISVKRTWNESEFDFQPIKNESSVRIIRVNKEVLELMNQIKRHAGKKQVFINQYNRVPTSSAVNQTLKQALRESNIDRKGFHFHSLRHTHVAYLLAKHIDLYVISKRLGHSDIGTTTRVYSYLIDEYKIKTDNQIEKALDEIGLNGSEQNALEVY